MQQKERIAVVHQIIDAVNRRDTAAATDFFIQQFVRHDLSNAFEGIAGRQGVSSLLQQILTAFPDLKMQIDHCVSDENDVVAYLTMAGTHCGVFLDIEPSGKPVRFVSINRYRFCGGKVSELWQLMDIAGLLRQIGVSFQVRH